MEPDLVQKLGASRASPWPLMSDECQPSNKFFKANFSNNQSTPIQLKHKNMNMKLLTVLGATILPFGLLAQGNLILNPNFNLTGGSGGVPADWSSDAGGNYNYADSSAPSYASGGQIFSLGWWDGAGTWQNTGATIAPNTGYELTATAAVGQSPLTGITLSFQDVTTGWTWLASQQFLFSAADQTSGQYETFTLNIPSSAISSFAGDTTGVGVSLSESPNNQYGWLHLDNVSLVAVPTPEPSALALLGATAVGGFLLVRRAQRPVAARASAN